MGASARRFLLRERTRDYHDQLDTQIGTFDDRRGYARYLAGQVLFRAAVEPQLRRHEFDVSFGGWRPTLIASELLEDLADLELESIGPQHRFVLPTDMSGLLGVLYVLEGSALGARVLVRRAEEIGFTNSFGARHLHAQTARDSWIAFQHILESAHPCEIDRAAETACEMFRMASNAFKRTKLAELPG